MTRPAEPGPSPFRGGVQITQPTEPGGPTRIEVFGRDLAEVLHHALVVGHAATGLQSVAETEEGAQVRASGLDETAVVATVVSESLARARRGSYPVKAQAVGLVRRDADETREAEVVAALRVLETRRDAVSLSLVDEVVRMDDENGVVRFRFHVTDGHAEGGAQSRDDAGEDDPQ